MTAILPEVSRAELSNVLAARGHVLRKPTASGMAPTSTVRDSLTTRADLNLSTMCLFLLIVPGFAQAVPLNIDTSAGEMQLQNLLKSQDSMEEQRFKARLAWFHSAGIAKERVGPLLEKSGVVRDAGQVESAWGELQARANEVGVEASDDDMET